MQPLDVENFGPTSRFVASENAIAFFYDFCALPKAEELLIGLLCSASFAIALTDSLIEVARWISYELRVRVCAKCVVFGRPGVFTFCALRELSLR